MSKEQRTKIKNTRFYIGSFFKKSYI